jgi:hypothetical protein
VFLFKHSTWAGGMVQAVERLLASVKPLVQTQYRKKKKKKTTNKNTAYL